MSQIQYPKREIFPSAPLALVTAEIRFSYEPSIKDETIRDAFATSVREWLPILQNEVVQNLTIAMPNVPISEESFPQIRAMSASRTVSACLNPNAILFESVAYAHFEDFLGLVQNCLSALAVLVPKLHVTRVGLRYLDELRMPGMATELGGWGRWVNEDLLGSIKALPGSEAGSVSGITLFSLDEDSDVLFRWGTYVGQTVIAPQMPLSRPTFPSGQMFVLDIDSFNNLGTQHDFNTGWLIGEFERLHQPVGTIFSWALTDEARSVFREAK